MTIEASRETDAMVARRLGHEVQNLKAIIHGYIDFLPHAIKGESVAILPPYSADTAAAIAALEELGKQYRIEKWVSIITKAINYECCIWDEKRAAWDGINAPTLPLAVCRAILAGE